jgi:capsule polysaccharide export protein KpsC/LpsZ
MKNKLFIGFSKWKINFLKIYFGKDIIISSNLKKIKNTLYNQSINKVYFWNYNDKYQEIIDLCSKKQNIQNFFVEDGFIRSNSLGISKSFPLSLTIDSLGMHFDYYKPTYIEFLLNKYVCSDYNINQAKLAINEIKKKSFTKYNLKDRIIDNNVFTSSSDKTKILIVSQVPTDNSIIYSGFNQNNNNIKYFLDLIHKDYQNSEIVYKVHPDIIHNKNDFEIINDYQIKVLTKPIYNKYLFHNVDVVYTISSLLGLEALIHGVKNVVCLGCPFYSGWGLTKDIIINSRRTKKLSLEELFFISYIKYPIYKNFYGKKSDIFKTFNLLNYSI